jgi:hypothetical protein
MYVLFVCGAPHNKKGFELAIVEGNKTFPDECIQYIDKYDADKMIDGNTYVIQNINCKQKKYLLIESYISINPSDQKTSRGAYIAVGVITDDMQTLSSTINYFCKIVSIHSALGKLRDSRNAFPSRFSIDKDIGKLKLNYKDIGFLSNIALEHFQHDSVKKIVFNDLEHFDKQHNLEDTAIINQINEQEKEIILLQKKIEEEQESHRLTVMESKGYIQKIDQLNQENTELQDKIQRLQTEISNLYNQPNNSELGIEPYITHHQPYANTSPRQNVPPVSTLGNSTHRQNTGGYQYKKRRKSKSSTDILLTGIIDLATLIHTKNT